MYFEIECTACHKKLRVREDLKGQKVRCPYCHLAQLVQAPEPPPDDNPLSFLTDSTSAETTTARSSVSSASTSSAKPKGKSSGSAKPTAASGKHEEATSGTDVNALPTAIVGFAAFVVVYAVLYPFRGTFLGALLWDRGWVQFAETFMACWAGAILFFKFRKLTAQKDSMLFDLLPSSISKDIAPESVDKFLKNIQDLPVAPSESFLVNRVLRGLEHFRILKDTSEVVGRVGSQSEIDSNEVDASYSLIKVLVWAIPILGFIGTVQGIGAAVGSFAATMQAANDMSALKESFNEVTGGLGTAFDTTLLALLLSMLIMFPMSTLQKAEQGLLNWVDEYCNENLFKRLKGETAAPTSNGVDTKALQSAIDAAMANHHAELRTWTKKLDSIGESLTQHAVKGWTKLDEQVQARHAQTVKQLQQSAESINEVAGRFKSLSDKQGESITRFGESSTKAQADVGQAIKQNADAIRQSTEALQKYLGSVEQGLSSLNQVLGELGAKQIVIEQVAATPKRKWGLFGK